VTVALSNKPLLRLTENDLLALIADKEAEGKTLDYKRNLVGIGATGKKEFLFDVSSFANTQGGHLVFGMEEKNGEAVNLIGLAA
jgi:predicted HTH transcriptional regulator